MEMVEKKEIKNKMILFTVILFFILAYIFFRHSSTYAFDELDENIIQNIENGTTKITYELFGAKGDGVTNDIEAIRGAHEFANKEYIEKGILYTVYACDNNDCSDKNYYLGDTDNGGIDIITNVDWKNANFIVDDYIDTNNDETNDVDLEEEVFNITSPLKIYSKINGGSLTYLTYNSDVLKKLSTNKSINPNTTNLKELVDALYNQEVNTTNFYNKNISEIEKYYNSSQRWIIFITNSNKQYIRKGVNSNSGNNQSELIVVDSNNGNVLTEINWIYDDISQIIVYPIPDTKISVKNGRFTTYTSNVVYTTDENGNAKKPAYSKRNLFINYTGNVSLSNIHHYLNEEKHTYTNEYQSVSNGNLYYGFLRIHNAAFIETNNIYLSAHTPTNIVSNNQEKTSLNGTYDLVIDNSANIFLNNINYACNIYNEDGTKNYSQCYNNNITNKNKWGIMASNVSKNVFITNSKMNRIDAHRGITNLYVSDTTIGRSASSNSLTLIGKGYFYGNNLKIDAPECILKLRDDYGSTWDGTMVFNNLNYIIHTASTNPVIIYSNNEENWDFGYTTYFPNIYINGLNIDTTTRAANNVTDITFIRLSNLYNTTTNTSTIDKSNERNLYNFKGNIYLNDLTTNGNTFKLFKYGFIKSSGNTLNKENYGGNNIVNIYLDSDVSIDSKLYTSDNTKFNIVSTMDNKSDVVRKYFDELKVSSQMPDPLSPIIGKITLSTGQINEKISGDITNYTATVNSSNVTIELETAYIGTRLSWDSKTVELNYGSNIVEFSITGSDGKPIDYTLTITRPYELQVNVEGYYYDSINNYLYTKYDTNSTVILNKLNITDAVASIDNDYLIINNKNKEELACVKIVNFDTNYTISDNNINVKENIDYESLMNGINANGITLKVFNSNDNEISSGKIVSGYKMKIYYGNKLLDTYIVSTYTDVLEYSLEINNYNVTYEENILLELNVTSKNIDTNRLEYVIENSANQKITPLNIKYDSLTNLSKISLSLTKPNTNDAYSISVYYDDNLIDTLSIPIVVNQTITSSKYKIDENNLTIYVDPTTKLETFKANITSMDTNVYKNNAKVNSGYITTGMTISNYTIIVKGDVTGDGLVKMNDVMKISKYIVDATGMAEEVYKKAADVTNDSNIRMNDVMKISTYIVEGGTL